MTTQTKDDRQLDPFNFDNDLNDEVHARFIESVSAGIQRAGIDPDGYDGNAALNFVLDTWQARGLDNIRRQFVEQVTKASGAMEAIAYAYVMNVHNQRRGILPEVDQAIRERNQPE